MSKFSISISCCACVFMGVGLPAGYSQDNLLKKITLARDRFEQEMSSGAEFRHEDHRDSKLHEVYTVRIKNGNHIAGRNLPIRFFPSESASNSQSTSISISGDKFGFVVTPTSSLGGSQKVFYNLHGISLASSEFQDHPVLYGCDRDMPRNYVHMPWSFAWFDIEDLIAHYENVTIDQPSQNSIRVHLLGLRDPKKMSAEKSGRTFDELELIFREDRNWQLSESMARIESTRDDGSRRSLVSKRIYYSKENEWGFGAYDNNKLVKGHVFVDTATSKATTDFELGERLRWVKTSVSDAEFSPHNYGIDPNVGLAESPINWWFWGWIGMSAGLIVFGVLLRKRGVA